MRGARKQCLCCGSPISKWQVYCNMACRVAYAQRVREEFKELTAEKLKLIFTYDAANGRLVSKPYRTERPRTGSIDSSGYRQFNIFRRMHLEHRLIWLFHFGEWPSQEIDHINHDRLDNRIENLREVSRAENSRNLPVPTTTKHGVPGVRPTKGGKWTARIGAGRRLQHLGTFTTKDEAISARRVAERQMGFHPNHGQNVPT